MDNSNNRAEDPGEVAVAEEEEEGVEGTVHEVEEGEASFLFFFSFPQFPEANETRFFSLSIRSMGPTLWVDAQVDQLLPPPPRWLTITTRR